MSELAQVLSDVAEHLREGVAVDYDPVSGQESYRSQWDHDAAQLVGHALHALSERRDDEQQELAMILPGTAYMDPPDGGSPSILEQFQRMAKDAERYRWLREQHNPPSGLPIAQVVWKSGSDPRGEWVNLLGPENLDDNIDCAIRYGLGL